MRSVRAESSSSVSPVFLANQALPWLIDRGKQAAIQKVCEIFDVKLTKELAAKILEELDRKISDQSKPAA